MYSSRFALELLYGVSLPEPQLVQTEFKEPTIH